MTRQDRAGQVEACMWINSPKLLKTIARRTKRRAIFIMEEEDV